MYVVKFYSPTCVKCRMVDKILDKLGVEEVVSMDITDETFAKEVDYYNVTSLPHTVFFSGDEKLHVVGTLDYSEYKKAYDGARGDTKKGATKPT